VGVTPDTADPFGGFVRAFRAISRTIWPFGILEHSDFPHALSCGRLYRGNLGNLGNFFVCFFRVVLCGARFDLDLPALQLPANIQRTLRRASVSRLAFGCFYVLSYVRLSAML
jgi:hypothetical protein